MRIQDGKNGAVDTAAWRTLALVVQVALLGI